VSTPLMTLFNACFAGIAFLYALPNNLKKTYQVGGLWVVFIAALLGCSIFNGFSLDALQFQFLSESPWMSEMKIDLDFGLDGISFVFLVLTVLIFPFCVLAS